MRSRFILALSTVLLASTVVAGCGGGKATSTATGTKASPYTSGNYPGILKIGNPYDIAGRTYYPAHDPDYVEEGIASWYGPKFHGRATANGERFDQNQLTAAHRTLPLPSMVRVTNLENGRVSILKVNDRGPFAKDRIIDLSKKAAEDLGVIAKGTAHVRVEYLPNETRQLVAGLLRNNQIKADSATLTMLAMNDLQYEGAVASDAGSGFGLISSAQAAEPVYGATVTGAVSERAPLAPVTSQDLPAAQGSETQMARIERTAPASAQPIPYGEGGVVPRTMPLNADEYGAASSAEVNAPVQAEPILPDTTFSPQPYSTPAEPARPQELQPLPQEVEAPAYQPAPAATQPGLAASPTGFFIQAGSFSQESNAHDLSQRLAGLGRTSVKPVDINGRTWYRVRLGPINDPATMQATLQNVQSMGVQDARVVKD